MPMAHASNTTTAGEAAMPMSAKAKVGLKGGMPKFVDGGRAFHRIQHGNTLDREHVRPAGFYGSER